MKRLLVLLVLCCPGLADTLTFTNGTLNWTHDGLMTGTLTNGSVSATISGFNSPSLDDCFSVNLCGDPIGPSVPGTTYNTGYSFPNCHSAGALRRNSQLPALH
jgi:hypothetical protein